MQASERFELMVRGLQEIIGTEPVPDSILNPDQLKTKNEDIDDLSKSRIKYEKEFIKTLSSKEESKEPFKIYWGTAVTGMIHVGYILPLLKIADFLRAKCHVTILFADVHAFLDNLKSDCFGPLLQARTSYYEEIIKTVLTDVLKVDISSLHFVKGSDYQLTPKYTTDVYKLASVITERNAKKAGAEVVRQVESPFLSSMLYPLLQALDEQYLDCDAQFGGVDQRKIFMMASEYLPKIKYKKRFHLMNPIISLGLGNSEKMSSSDKQSKIDLLDSSKEVVTKIKHAYCDPAANVKDNCLIGFIKNIVFPVINNINNSTDNKCGFPVEINTELTIDELSKQISKELDDKKNFIISSDCNNKDDQKTGKKMNKVTITFMNYLNLEKLFVSGILYPNDLKSALSNFINTVLLSPIRKKYKLDSTNKSECKDEVDLVSLVKTAYPDSNSRPDYFNTITNSNIENCNISNINIVIGKVVSVCKPISEFPNLLKLEVLIDNNNTLINVIAPIGTAYDNNIINKLVLVILKTNIKKLPIRKKMSTDGILLAFGGNDNIRLVTVKYDNSVNEANLLGSKVTTPEFLNAEKKKLNLNPKMFSSIVNNFSYDSNTLILTYNSCNLVIGTNDSIKFVVDAEVNNKSLPSKELLI